ncbi:unnamed protein product (mitochondrion) [Plasmodiophora brassicae]|uniref:Autophagy-related protein 13 N-terminal domain-containing protein n=1 Tax=Plasmodiophora brassicae TaxID=37360 RepID=A0A0G4J872_PLABS|nr:hypothetical protein PBRA_003420 [Plasmodiophora brassicae]SPQ99768.1 unnamed protein product [Plasmodiophora brassicae]
MLLSRFGLLLRQSRWKTRTPGGPHCGNPEGGRCCPPPPATTSSIGEHWVVDDADARVMVVSDRAARQRMLANLTGRIVNIVLDARILSSDPETRRSSRSFNFEASELASGRSTSAPGIDFGRGLPLHLDISLSWRDEREGVLLERWSLNVEEGAGYRGNLGTASVYQHALVMLRSLHSLLRILPVHKLFLMGERALDRVDPLLFNLYYSISYGTPDATRTFVNTPVNNFVFGPVNAGPSGSLHLSVFYRPHIQYDVAMHTPELAQPVIIADYVRPSRLPDGWCDTGGGGPFSTLPDSISRRDLLTTSIGTPPFSANPSILNSTPPSIASSSLPVAAPPQLTMSPFHSSASSFCQTTPVGSFQIESDLGFARVEQGDHHAQVGSFVAVLRAAPQTLTFHAALPSSVAELLNDLDGVLAQNRSLAPMHRR